MMLKLLGKVKFGLIDLLANTKDRNDSRALILMIETLTTILSQPFLLVQIGDYGHGYESTPLPRGLEALAKERAKRGKQIYPENRNLPPPHFYIPSDVQGILMNKSDELSINRFAYWAQKLNTLVNKHGCINSKPEALFKFSNIVNLFWAVLIKKDTTLAPKGSKPGRVFERWTPSGYVCEPPTDQIDTDVVYTEVGKTTLIFESLEVLGQPERIDLNQYHVFFSPEDGQPQRLPYRSSMYGTCSLLMRGRPDEETGIPLLKQENACCDVVAFALIHPHICGRVVSGKK